MAAGMPSMSQPPPTSRTTYRAGPTINQRPQMYTRQPEAPPPKPAPSFEGPVITVFVGNISERAPEPMIKRILAAVGSVISWKRVSTFGFCEYELVNHVSCFSLTILKYKFSLCPLRTQWSNRRITCRSNITRFGCGRKETGGESWCQK